MGLSLFFTNWYKYLQDPTSFPIRCYLRLSSIFAYPSSFPATNWYPRPSVAIDGTKLKAGVYAIPVKVGYKSVTPESVVRVEFSRDGSPPTDPTIDSRVLDHNTITSTGLFYVKARAFRQGYADSAIVSSYFLAAKASAGGQDVCGADVLQQVRACTVG